MRIYSQDIGMESGIEICAMLIMKRGKRKTVEVKELPNQKSISRLWENKNKYLGILEADTIKQAEIKEKIRRAPQKNKKTSQNQTLPQKSHQRDKHQDSPPCKILRTILNMDKGRTQTNGPKKKNVNNNAQGDLHLRDDIECMYWEKKEEENSLILRIALIHQYKDLKSILECAKKDKLKQLIIVLGTLIQIEKQQKTRKQKWEEKLLYEYFKQQTGEIVYTKRIL